MRKKFFFFIFLFLSIISFNALKIHAEEEKRVGQTRIEGADILYGMNKDDLKKSSFINDIKELESLNIIESGYITSMLEFRAYKFNYDLVTTLTFSNGKFINYNASFSNIVFYDFDYINNDYVINKNNPMAIKTIYGDTVSCQETIGDIVYNNIDYKTGSDITDIKSNLNLVNRILINYIYYQLEEEKNLNINVAASAAPNINLILSSTFDNYYVETNNYLPYNSFISSDTYKATVFVYEKDKYIKYNTNINVLNKELSSPIIKVKDSEELSLNDIKDIIEDANSISLNYFDIITNRYSDYKDVEGEYINTYLVKDINNIYYLLDVKIIVESSSNTPIDVTNDTPKTTTSMPTATSNPVTKTSTPTPTTTPKPSTTTKTPKTTTLYPKTTTSNQITSSPTTTIPVDNTNTDINDDTIVILDILTEEFKYSYKDKINIDNLLNEIVYESTYDIKDISYETDYKNDNTVGLYTLNVIITDIKDNTLNKEVSLTIYDDIKPVLVLPTIITNISTPISLSEIQNKILVVDEVDGEISSKNIKLTDIDNYQLNYNKSGSFEINAKVSDKSGNEAKASFLIIVSDSKDYNNYEENNVINLTNTNKISKRDFISYLAKNNYITNSNITLTSTYFNVDNPDGEYELTVKSSTTEKKYTINVYNGIVNKKITLDEKANNNYYIYYIVIGSSTLFVLLITILSIIMYKKKRNKE